MTSSICGFSIILLLGGTIYGVLFFILVVMLLRFLSLDKMVLVVTESTSVSVSEGYQMFTDENSGGKLTRSRNARTGFLFFAILLTFSRALYLEFWTGLHYADPDCPTPSETSGDPPWMDVFGTIPSAFFLSAFSINIKTFARIFHLVSHQHIERYNYMTVFLWLVNLCVYTSLILSYAAPAGSFRDVITSYILVWTVVICEIIIGFFLFCYSFVLYYSFPTEMKKLFYVCFTCFLCMVTKAVLMLAIILFYDGSYNYWTFPLYFIISEIIPLTLMITIEFLGTSSELDYGSSFNDVQRSGIV